jgi:GNAT superfamily N-acetyltransferase
MPTKTIRPRWGSPSGDTSAPHYLTDDDIAQLSRRYSIASPNRLDKELRRAVRAIWMYQLSRTRASLAEQRAALLELAHHADWLSDRLRRGVLDPEARRRLRAAYADLDPDWRKQNITGPLLARAARSAKRRGDLGRSHAALSVSLVDAAAIRPYRARPNCRVR